MNAEMLYSITEAVRADLNSTQIGTLTQQLVVALESQVATPGEPIQQQAVADAAKRIRDALNSSAANQFSPAWRQALDEMGISALIGHGFRRQIDEIFFRNQITPSVALDEVRTLSQRLTELNDAIDQLIASLDYFRIHTMTLEDGTTEIGFTIPRHFVDNDLKTLGVELGRMNRILGPLNELGVGGRPQISIRTISSSDFTILVKLLPRAAVIFATSVTWLQHTYKQMLDARLIKKQLEEMQFSANTAALIEREASGRMMTAIGTLVDNLMEKYGIGIDESRAPELRVDLKASLSDLSKRIDIGMNFEIRAADVAKAAEGATDAENEVQTAEQITIEEIRSMANEIENFELGGSAILEITEANVNDSEDDLAT